MTPGNNFELKKLTLKPGKYYIWCNGEKAGYLMCGDWSGIYVSPDKCVSKASGMIEVLVQSSNNKELENIVSFYSPLKVLFILSLTAHRQNGVPAVATQPNSMPKRE